MIEIDIREALKNEGKVYIFQYEGAPALGEDISFAKPLELNAEYVALNRNISVRGKFETVLNTVCDRCLDDMEMEIAYRFDETIFRTGTQEEEEYTYEGDVLSLDKLVYGNHFEFAASTFVQRRVPRHLPDMRAEPEPRLVRM